MINSISKYTISLTKNLNRHVIFMLLVFLPGLCSGQLSATMDFGKTYYSSSGVLSRFNRHSGHVSGRDFLQIYQNNMLSGSFHISYAKRNVLLLAGLERNSITVNKVRFDRNGQLTRSFWFSVLSLGAGKTWVISQPETTKISINLTAYGFAILNRKGLEENSRFYFSPSSSQSQLDERRESYSIRGRRNLGLGLKSRMVFSPRLKNSNISFFAAADISLTTFFTFSWRWKEDSYPLPVTDPIDCHRRTLSMGIEYKLTKK